MSTTSITISEALSDIKTIDKRLRKQREFVQTHVAYSGSAKDPFEAEGGIRKVIGEKLQSIGDLEERVIAIRTAILNANLTNRIVLNGKDRSVQEWLTWRREVVHGRRQFFNFLATEVDKIKLAARQKDLSVAKEGETAVYEGIEFVVPVLTIQDEQENLEQILGDLDGKLSVHNANTTIEI